MISSNTTDGLLVTLHVEQEQKLYLMLTSDGLVKRMGDGSEDSAEDDLFVGKSSLREFEAVRPLFDSVLENWLGRYSAPETAGKPCNLIVGFQTVHGEEYMSEWEYGTESQGPPPEITKIVIAAVEATNEWYEKQKLLAARNL